MAFRCKHCRLGVKDKRDPAAFELARGVVAVHGAGGPM
ncbi:hypothetical protein BN2497_3689 [Janthinobacterium sp. CG23_2]|nr:hypothetical protein BN2497_3689 [Janthinobacterium sp. CG23_2]CUU28242.1 hypothetical protein BN3177_3689 [Janthinobacterium sp. CG23_2]